MRKNIISFFMMLVIATSAIPTIVTANEENNDAFDKSCA